MSTSTQTNPKSRKTRTGIAADDLSLFEAQTGDIVNAAEATLERNLAVETRMVSVKDLVPDPANCRLLQVDIHDLSTFDPAQLSPQTPNYQHVRKTLEEIHHVGESYDDVGQMHNLRAYKRPDGKLQIIFGHIRFYAALVKGKTMLNVDIVEKPTRLRLAQHMENDQGAVQSPYEKLLSVKAVIEEDRALGGEAHKSGAGIGRLLRKTKATGSTYKKLLDAPSDVIDALSQGVLTLSEAARLVGLPAKERDAFYDKARARLVTDEAVEWDVAVTTNPRPAAPVARKRAGAKAVSVYRLQSESAEVAEVIINALKRVAGKKPKDLNDALYELDYDDVQQVNRAIKALVNHIEASQ